MKQTQNWIGKMHNILNKQKNRMGNKIVNVALIKQIHEKLNKY